MRLNHRVPGLPILLLAVTLGLSACDLNLDDIELKIDLQKEPITLPSGVGQVAVLPNQSTSSTSTMQNPLSIDRIEDLKEIGLQASFFSFTPAAGKTQADGTFRIVLALNGVPLPQVIVVTIVNDQVTQVQPTAITFAGATVDRTAIEAVLNSLPANQRPDLKDWKNMTINQIVAEINAGLRAASFPFTIAILTSGNLSGGLKLNQFTIDAEVVAG
jgi:hypothetical protein